MSPGGVLPSGAVEYYARRARSGIGLIITEGTTVPQESAADDDNVPRFHGPEAITRWRQVVEMVHAAGGHIIPQLWHVGLVQKRTLEDNLVENQDYSAACSPSGLIWEQERFKQVTNPATDEKITEAVDAFAKAAATAHEIGCDGVELHGGHGFLIDQFSWAETNKRKDKWGGGISERTALAVAIVRAIRERVGHEFPIIFRCSQWKVQNFSVQPLRTPAELEAFLGPIADAGVSAFHCSQRRFWDPEFEGSSFNLAGWAKYLTGKPTISVGSVGLQRDFASGLQETSKIDISHLRELEERLDKEEFDLIAIGRALIANPDWLIKFRCRDWNQFKEYEPEMLGSLY